MSFSQIKRWIVVSLARKQLCLCIQRKSKWQLNWCQKPSHLIDMTSFNWWGNCPSSWPTCRKKQYDLPRYRLIYLYCLHLHHTSTHEGVLFIARCCQRTASAGEGTTLGYIHPPFFFLFLCVSGLSTSCALWFTWGNALARSSPSFPDSCTSIDGLFIPLPVPRTTALISPPGIMRNQAELASCILIPGSFMHLHGAGSLGSMHPSPFLVEVHAYAWIIWHQFICIWTWGHASNSNVSQGKIVLMIYVCICICI